MSKRVLTIDEAKKAVLFFIKKEDEAAALEAMSEIVKATIVALEGFPKQQ